MKSITTYPADTKKVFWKKGTCSQTFCFLLNREFGHLDEPRERATDPLAGGLLNTGHQCGMLWGASLAVGAESYRNNPDRETACTTAINSTRKIMRSFSEQTGTVNCREIIRCNLTTRLGMAKLIVKTILGGFYNSPCFNLAEKWAPEAIRTATKGLSVPENSSACKCENCASEMAAKMGANEEETIMVSGFAGGMGLSGNACGALAVAIWLKTLAWCRAHPGETPPYFNNPEVKKIFEAFNDETGGKIRCTEITGRKFGSPEDHDAYMQAGGCRNLIEQLAAAAGKGMEETEEKTAERSLA